jgi:4-amino-4-deoxy-L-arabinose transferase-like glycosyltransferase
VTLLSDDRAGVLERDQAPTGDGARPESTGQPTLMKRLWSVPAPIWLGLTLALGLVVRLTNLNAFGFNSDEAVYAGQAASLAGNPLFVNQFPIFRAHPLLLPTLLSPLFRSGTPDLRGRVVVAFLGVATLFALYLVGKEMYGPKTGILGALILALMPYHMVVTRQLLLDGPAVLWITLSFWMLARFVRTNRFEWLAASAATLGLAVLTKETSAVVAGSMIIFLLVSSEVRRPGRAVVLTLGVLAAVSLVFPLAIDLAGHKSTGQNYLAWQLTRSSNHAGTFYLTVIPAAIGWLVVAAAGSALFFRVNRTWRELMLVLWIIVPFVTLEVYPLKGYQYLLPVAPAVALLAARALTTWHLPARLDRYTKSIVRPVVIAVVLVSLLPGAWSVMFPTVSASALAGQGGVAGGREAGKWVGANLVPGTELMTIGPSLANILEYYGHRPAQGLSVSTNPLHRNPAYTPIYNPDLSVRSGQFTYLVWDTYSAYRSPSTARRMHKLITKYHGFPIHTVRVNGKPVIIFYEVHP